MGIIGTLARFDSEQSNFLRLACTYLKQLKPCVIHHLHCGSNIKDMMMHTPKATVIYTALFKLLPRSRLFIPTQIMQCEYL